METTKKETLLKVLENLVPYWAQAEWFLMIVKNNEDNSLNDAIYDMITKEIKGIKDKSKMENIKDTLKKIRGKEEAYNEGYKDLDNLINNL